MNLRAMKLGVLAVFFILGFATGISRVQASSAKMMDYRHKGEGFSLKLPGGWEIQEDLKYQSFKIPLVALQPLQNAQDAFRENANVVVEKIPALMGLEGYYQANQKNMRGGLTAFKMIKNAKLKAGEADSKYIIYTHKVAEVAGKVKVIAFMYVKGAKAYVLTCSSTEKEFGRYLDVFMAIGRSFKPTSGD